MSAAQGGHQASIFEDAHCVSERLLTPSTVMLWTQRHPGEFRIRRMEQAINLHTEPNPLICRGIRSLVRGATSSQSGPHSHSRRRDVHPGIVGHVDALDIEASSKTPPCRERPNGSETSSTEAKVTYKSRIHDWFQNCYQKVVALRDSSRASRCVRAAWQAGGLGSIEMHESRAINEREHIDTSIQLVDIYWTDWGRAKRSQSPRLANAGLGHG